ncbi:MAG: AMP-binding enzyme [Bacillota bacterium]
MLKGNDEIHFQVRELEKLISAIQGVNDVVVISTAHPSGDQVLRAFVETEDDRELTAQLIINHCLKKSTCHRAPVSVTFGKIPRTPSGKVARQLLLEQCAV